MAIFLLRLPSVMRDHLIAKACTLVAEYADLLHSLSRMAQKFGASGKIASLIPFFTISSKYD
jgi:hypothetical protein